MFSKAAFGPKTVLARKVIPSLRYCESLSTFNGNVTLIKRPEAVPSFPTEYITQLVPMNASPDTAYRQANQHPTSFLKAKMQSHKFETSEKQYLSIRLPTPCLPTNFEKSTTAFTEWA